MRSLRRLCNFLALLLAVCLLGSCAAPQSTAGEITFCDSTGAQITLAAAPTRVAVLFSSLADIWVTAGGEVAITVGESVERGICKSDVTLVDTGAGKSIDREALLAARPDLVLCSADIAAQAETAAFLTQMGIPAAQFRVESFDDYLAVLGTFTSITGNANALLTHGTAQQAAIEATVAAQPFSGKNILFIRAGTSARSVKAKGTADHFACAMLARMGATNIADTAPILAEGLSMEAILSADPDYIFFTAMGDEAASHAYVTEMLKGAEWQALRAVREGRYTFLEKDLFHYKPNARWSEAYSRLAATQG